MDQRGCRPPQKLRDILIARKAFRPRGILQLTLSVSFRFEDNDVSFLKEEADRYGKKYGAEEWQKIVAEKAWVGMTEEQALLSWEKPKSRSLTTVSGGTSEQWVDEDGNFLYVTNGKVPGIEGER